MTNYELVVVLDGKATSAKKKSFIEKLSKNSCFPFEQYHCKYRENLEIAERYKSTQLGFQNVEEWIFFSLFKYYVRLSKFPETELKKAIEKDTILKKWLLNNIWHPMSRFDLPRLQYSEQIHLGHLHDLNQIKKLLIDFKLNKGNVINFLLENNI